MPTPPRPIRNKAQTKPQFQCFLDGRVRRSLRASFHSLIERDLLGNRTVISFDEGTRAQLPDNENPVPDTAYFDPALHEPTRPNRAPGDIKPSWEWSMGLQNGTDSEQAEFKKVLAQINHYMEQNETRYGFVLTNVELVAIRRTNRAGHLELLNPVSWTAYGSEEGPQLTVLLALWYLGMLASDNDNWRLELFVFICFLVLT